MPSSRSSAFAAWLNNKCRSTFGKIFAEEIEELPELTTPSGYEFLAVVCPTPGASKKLRIENLPAGAPGGPHDHDDRYYTETEADARFAAANDARLSDARTPTAHTHDDRYFTETEADARFAAANDARLSDARTPTAHTHDDRYFTETEADARFAAANDARLSDARTPTAHTHDDRYFTETEADARFAAANDARLSDARTPTAHAHSQSDVTGLVAALAALAGGSLPAGLIALWSGLLENVPNGWALCDGTNGTPDLRDRFVKGWSNGVDPGGTGGSATHTHNDHAALNHSGAAVADHTYTPQGTNSGGAVSAHAGAAVADHAAHTHGAGSLAVGDHASHTHAYTDVPNHTHPVNVTDPGHSHTQRYFPTATGGSAGDTADTSMSGTQTNTGLTTTTATTGITATTSNPGGGVASGTTQGPSSTLTHTVSGNTGNPSATLTHSVTQPSDHTFTQPTFTGTQATLQHSVTQPNAHTISAHSSASNEPAYFKLAYIMKL